MVVRFDGLPLGMSIHCFYCGRRVRRAYCGLGAQMPEDAFSRDHVVPKCQGGVNGPVVTACFKCNQSKFRLSLDEYRVLEAFRAGVIGLPEYKFAAEQLPA